MPSFRLSLKFLICFALRKNQEWAWWDRLSALLQWYWQRTFDEPLVFRTEDAGRLRAEHQAGLLNYEGCQTSERKAELGPSHPGEPQDEVSEAQRHEVSSQTHPASEDHTKNWNLGLWFEVQHSFHDPQGLCLALLTVEASLTPRPVPDPEEMLSLPETRCGYWEGTCLFRGAGAWNLKEATLGLEQVGGFNKMAESGVSQA
ncbi:uncharacterized protein LOC123859782 isoform X3 [Mirounga angustirostris]|uniref:uncharacterized protein LOC123859782 isoform X3 n=1 Tax=Mirounga angustirostris TaxID=9716 RepID=UPI001E688A15|nr:uncharacterized protein LOC123859782 isoform X4 [Mirounga angustirostris]